MSNSADKTESDPAGDSGEEVLDLTEEVDPGEAGLDDESSDQGSSEQTEEAAESSDDSEAVARDARETIREAPEDVEGAFDEQGGSETPSAAVVSQPGNRTDGPDADEAATGDGTPEAGETTPQRGEVPEDDEEPPAVFQTIQMEAVDRTVIEREGQMRQLEQTEPLESSEFAPEIIVQQPGELVDEWHQGLPGAESASAGPEAEEAQSDPALAPTEPSGHAAASAPTDGQAPEGSQPPPKPDDPEASPAPASDPEQSPPPSDVSGPEASSPADSSSPTSDNRAPADSGRTDTPQAPPSKQPAGSPDSTDDADEAEEIPVVEPEEDEVVEEVEEVEEVQEVEAVEPAAPGAPTAPEGHDSPPDRPQPPPETPEAPSSAESDEELGEIVEELVDEDDEPERRDRDDWVEKVFGELFLATVPSGVKESTKKDADFIEGRLSLDEAEQVLDLACGYGRHTLELTERGHNVVGFDLSKPLLKQGLAEAERRSLNVNFYHGDMRTLDFENVFDACFCWQTSFGYFGDRTNLDILARVNRALNSGGEFLLDVMNRDYVIQKMPHRIWWEGTDCIFLEEGEFDYESSVLHMNRSFIYEDGRPPVEQDWYIRLYTLHELKKLLERTGFEVADVSGSLHYPGYFLGHDSSRIVIKANKRRSVG